MNSPYIVILVTAKDTDEAKRIARRLLEEKLIACANVVSGVQSLFWWEGKGDEAAETLLVMKSVKKHFTKIVKTVKSIHSYNVPEIIAVPVVAGEKDYLRWIDASTKRSSGT